MVISWNKHTIFSSHVHLLTNILYIKNEESSKMKSNQNENYLKKEESSMLVLLSVNIPLVLLSHPIVYVQALKPSSFKTYPVRKAEKG